MDPLIVTASELDDYEWCPQYRAWRWDARRALVGPEPEWALLGKWAHTQLEGMMQGHPPDEALEPQVDNAKGRALLRSVRAWWDRFGLVHPWEAVLTTESPMMIDLGVLIGYACHHVDTHASQAVRTGTKGSIRSKGVVQELRDQAVGRLETVRPLPSKSTGDIHSTSRGDVQSTGGEVCLLWRSGEAVSQLRPQNTAKGDIPPTVSEGEATVGEQSASEGEARGMAKGQVPGPVHELQPGKALDGGMPPCPVCGTVAYSRKVIFRGIPDSVVIWHGELWHVSHKTAGASVSIQALIAGLAQDLHENLYPLLIRDLWPGLPYGGTMANVVRKVAERRSNEDAAQALHLEFIPISNERIESARRDALAICEDIAAGNPRRRRKSCTGKFGNSLCAYYGPCWQGISIESPFYQATNPLERYEGTE